jgi:hypothetical protein
MPVLNCCVATCHKAVIYCVYTGFTVLFKINQAYTG